MKKLLFILSLLVAPPAIAQNAPAGAQRVQGVPSGFGDPVQVTLCSPNGSGCSGGSSGGAVTIADGADVTQGAKADAAAAADNSTASVTALLKRNNQNLTTINTTLGTPLQVGGSIGLSGTLPAYGTTPTFNLGTLNGAALDATIATMSAKLPSSVGAKTGALSLSVVPNTDTAFPVTCAACATSANQTTSNTSLAAIATSVAAATPAGSNTIGGVTLDSVADAAVNSTTVSSAANGWSGSTVGYGSVTFQIIANASGNTIIIEGSYDGGTTWGVIVSRLASQIGTSPALSGGLSNISTPGFIIIPTMVAPMMRWRISSYIAGSTTVATGFKRSSNTNVVDAFVAGSVTNVVGASVAVANVGAQVYADTATPLTGSATFTGTTRDLGVSLTGSVAMFGATFIADQTGTAYIDLSSDGSTWLEAASVAVTVGSLAAGPSFDINVRIRARYYRVRFINGVTGQGIFRVYSSFTAS